MEQIIRVIDWIVLIISSAAAMLFLVSSLLEKERRAAALSLAGLAINAGIWLFFICSLHLLRVGPLNLAVLILMVIFVIVSLIRDFPGKPERDLAEIQQFDERDHMFARNGLQFQPHLAEKYYAAHPEKKDIDEKIHNKPELGEPGSTYYRKEWAHVFEAAFHYLGRMRPVTRGEVSPLKQDIEKENIAELLKALGLFYGAVDVGITQLKPYHIYSHAGRHAENWGEKITNTHRTAIVIIVAMEVGMIKQAPGLPVILESSRRYVEAAKIASIIAQYIRDLGYEARAHTDGNYEVLCVPAAVDAGLGVLGRIGLFIHPVYGPCVRISVVTTELELPASHPVSSREKELMAASIAHFCDICKKCADNCPTQSISLEEEPISRGFRHWAIKQEPCYSYWKSIGTDCGFCIRVCPYTKPDTLMHKLVRFYISRNGLNQRIALFMDDLFYGRKQKPEGKTSIHHPFLDNWA